MGLKTRATGGVATVGPQGARQQSQRHSGRQRVPWPCCALPDGPAHPRQSRIVCPAPLPRPPPPAACGPHLQPLFSPNSCGSRIRPPLAPPRRRGPAPGPTAPPPPAPLSAFGPQSLFAPHDRAVLPTSVASISSTRSLPHCPSTASLPVSPSPLEPDRDFWPCSAPPPPPPNQLPRPGRGSGEQRPLGCRRPGRWGRWQDGLGWGSILGAGAGPRHWLCPSPWPRHTHWGMKPVGDSHICLGIQAAGLSSRGHSGLQVTKDTGHWPGTRVSLGPHGHFQVLARHPSGPRGPQASGTQAFVVCT